METTDTRSTPPVKWEHVTQVATVEIFLTHCGYEVPVDAAALVDADVEDFPARPECL